MNNILDSPELLVKKEVMKYGSKGFQFTILGRTFRFETFIEGVKPPNILSCSEQLCERDSETIMRDILGTPCISSRDTIINIEGSNLFTISSVKKKSAWIYIVKGTYQIPQYDQFKINAKVQIDKYSKKFFTILEITDNTLELFSNHDLVPVSGMILFTNTEEHG